MLDFKKIQQECPKAWGLLKKWTEGKLKEFKDKLSAGSQEEIPFPDMNDILVESIVKTNVRGLYDFFDVQDVRVFIYDVPDTKKFIFYINSSENQGPYDTRVECETNAFQDAFKQLEEKL